MSADRTHSIEPPDRPGVSVRPVWRGEWPQVIHVLNAVYVGNGYTSPERAAALFRRETLEPAGTLLVAIDHRSVLGVVLLLHHGSPLVQVAGSEEAEFRLLAVAAHARGRGVGEVLVRGCMDLARGPDLAAKALVMWTRPQMIAAQRLYGRLGFRRVPERDALLAPLPAGSPALERWVYSCPLSS